MTTTLSRRRFMITSAAGLSAAGFALPVFGRVQERGGSLEVRELGDGVWGIIGNGGNSMLVRTGEGAVLVDTKVVTAGAVLLEQVRTLVGSAPVYVINTHHHADHVGGNYAFSGEAKIVAHKNVRPRLKSTVEKQVMPALRGQAEGVTVESFDADQELTDTLDLEHGGVTFALRHFGPGHTDNDIVVHLPQRNILHMGDLLFNKLHPFVDAEAGGTTLGWQGSLQRAMSLCDGATKVIPGHGEIGRRDILGQQSQYFTYMRGLVTGAMAGGGSREEATAINPEVYAQYGNERFRSLTLGTIHDEVTKAKAKAERKR